MRLLGQSTQFGPVCGLGAAIYCRAPVRPAGLQLGNPQFSTRQSLQMRTGWTAAPGTSSTPYKTEDSHKSMCLLKLSALRSNCCCQCEVQHQQLNRALFALERKHTSAPKYALARARRAAHAALLPQCAPGEPGAHI